MAKKKQSQDPVVEVAEAVSSEAGKESWTVFNERGVMIRTYSIEQHGVMAEQMAHQFATKINGSVA